MTINALVVDDSGIMRELVMRSLTESGLAEFMFSEASDGRDALAKFDPAVTDMVFVEWNLPNMSGIDFVREVRATHRRPVPVVMITTESTMGKVEEAFGTGVVDAYIIKPFTTDVLRRKLTRLFQKLAPPAPAKSGGFFSKLFRG